MARQKLGSRDLNKAKLRLGNLEAISPDLDLGDGLTLSAYAKVIHKCEERLKVYNSFLATLDGLRSELSIDMLVLRDFSERMLMGVGTKFGKNSPEYKKAGGTLKSERKRPKRTPPPQQKPAASS
jgi:hypothetical protein